MNVVTICSYILFLWSLNGTKKNAARTIAKHGLDFIGIEKVFDGETATVLDNRFDYGEERFVTFGLFDGRVVAVTHLETDGIIRIISVRKATSNEEENYFKQISD